MFIAILEEDLDQSRHQVPGGTWHPQTYRYINNSIKSKVCPRHLIWIETVLYLGYVGSCWWGSVVPVNTLEEGMWSKVCYPILPHPRNNYYTMKTTLSDKFGRLKTWTDYQIGGVQSFKRKYRRHQRTKSPRHSVSDPDPVGSGLFEGSASIPQVNS